MIARGQPRHTRCVAVPFLITVLSTEPLSGFYATCLFHSPIASSAVLCPAINNPISVANAGLNFMWSLGLDSTSPHTLMAFKSHLLSAGRLDYSPTGSYLARGVIPDRGLAFLIDVTDRASRFDAHVIAAEGSSVCPQPISTRRQWACKWPIEALSGELGAGG